METIILIGPMGAGKSAIGRQLAQCLAMPFFDTDDVIKERTGVEIALIFDIEGEAGFRVREQQVLETLLAERPAVIATGGGIVVNELNRKRMKDAGTVIFLETSIDWQAERTRSGRQRPLLDTPDPKTRLEQIYRARESLYRECAHITVNTNGRRVTAVSQDIIQRLHDLQDSGDRHG